tara:strand:+ start:391 stop:1116 length:726 start_codon:yes stop_codon:yes gene_type:complete
MKTKTCPHCGKKFKLTKSLSQHMILCELNSNKEDKEITVIPTQKEMWIILQKLYKDNEILKKKVEKLEEVMNRDVKKMNMLDWLNQNDKGVDIETWLKTSVLVTLDDLKMIFSSDYTRGLSNILENNINEKENNPFRAFSHKTKQLYIYEKNKWKKCKKMDIMKIFDRISLNILKKSKDYDKTLNHNEKYGADNIAYLKNCDKIMIVDTKKKERYYRHIESSIIGLTKKNLNDMAKFKFYL